MENLRNFGDGSQGAGNDTAGLGKHTDGGLGPMEPEQGTCARTCFLRKIGLFFSGSDLDFFGNIGGLFHLRRRWHSGNSHDILPAIAPSHCGYRGDDVPAMAEIALDYQQHGAL